MQKAPSSWFKKSYLFGGQNVKERGSNLVGEWGRVRERLTSKIVMCHLPNSLRLQETFFQLRASAWFVHMRVVSYLYKQSIFWEQGFSLMVKRCVFHLEVPRFENWFWLLTPASQPCRPWQRVSSDWMPATHVGVGDTEWIPGSQLQLWPSPKYCWHLGVNQRMGALSLPFPLCLSLSLVLSVAVKKWKKKQVLSSQYSKLWSLEMSTKTRLEQNRIERNVAHWHSLPYPYWVPRECF